MKTTESIELNTNGNERQQELRTPQFRVLQLTPHVYQVLLCE